LAKLQVFAYYLANMVPIHPWKLDIEQDESGHIIGHRGESAQSIGRGDDFDVFTLQSHLDDLTHSRTIVHNEDSWDSHLD
jgi:hypothetical protein